MANIPDRVKGGDSVLRPTKAIIDLSALRHNIRQIRQQIPSSTKMIAVVKANAYGHGAIPVSRTALGAGANELAVAIPEEGIELRAAGLQSPILVMGMFLPEQASLFVDHNLTASVSSADNLFALAKIANRGQKNATVMIKLDTGMGRVGVQIDAATDLINTALQLPAINLAGIFTHFAAADDPDPRYTRLQFQRLNQVRQELRKQQIKLPIISAANSAALAAFPETHLDAVRPGIIMYGLTPDPTMHLPLDLKPVMSFVTRIVHVKEVPAGTPVNYGCTFRTSERTWLATLPVGYADGYSRHLSNQAEVLIGGVRRPVVGRVCMDQLVVNLGSTLNYGIGDEAVLFGQQGKEEISLTELASKAGTINYELACAVSPRVPRIYRQ